MICGERRVDSDILSIGPMAWSASLVRFSDAKLGRPGPGITSGRFMALTTLAARRIAKNLEKFAIVSAVELGVVEDS
jgi:hypothetical protein